MQQQSKEEICVQKQQREENTHIQAGIHKEEKQTLTPPAACEEGVVKDENVKARIHDAERVIREEATTKMQVENRVADAEVVAKKRDEKRRAQEAEVEKKIHDEERCAEEAKAKEDAREEAKTEAHEKKRRAQEEEAQTTANVSQSSKRRARKQAKKVDIKNQAQLEKQRLSEGVSPERGRQLRRDPRRWATEGVGDPPWIRNSAEKSMHGAGPTLRG